MNLIMSCEATDFTKGQGTGVRLVRKDDMFSETKGLEMISLCGLKKSPSP